MDEKRTLQFYGSPLRGSERKKRLNFLDNLPLEQTPKNLRKLEICFEYEEGKTCIFPTKGKTSYNLNKIENYKIKKNIGSIEIIDKEETYKFFYNPKNN